MSGCRIIYCTLNFDEDVCDDEDQLHVIIIHFSSTAREREREGMGLFTWCVDTFCSISQSCNV